MLDCPRCRQPVDTQAVTCPHCRTLLKAYGHPGIPLHQATDEAYLCQTCLYDQDNSCTYPQHPFARQCMLYTNALMQGAPQPQSSPSQIARVWLRRYGAWLALIGLIIISVVLVFK